LKRLDENLSELRKEGENVMAGFDFVIEMNVIKIHIECWKN
jgi:hypothetical protein